MSNMSLLAEWLMENSDKIEKGVEILGQVCEILAATVGQFNPILEAVLNVSAELLSNPEGKEARYLGEQFVKVNQKLEKNKAEITNAYLVMQRSSVNQLNFNYYANINSQYEYFKYIFTAKPEYKKLKRDEFLIFFEELEGEKNLNCLYDAIMKTSGQTVLYTIVATEHRSRRAVEEFCTSLKKLFVVGIISLMGYAALKEDTVDEEMGKKWLARMEDVEKRMKAAVDECVNNFAEQAKSDMDKMLMDKQSSVDPEFTKFLLEALEKKYDWVSWSVRVFNDDDNSKLVKCMFGKKHHINGGVDNYFEHLCGNKIRVVVSFTADPKPLDKNQIKDQIEKEKGGVESVAESLSISFPNCLFHAINCCTKVEEANSFEPEHLYYISHKKAHICIHSE